MEREPSIDITDYINQQNGWGEMLKINTSHGKDPDEILRADVQFLIQYSESFHGYYLHLIVDGRSHTSHRIDLERGKIGSRITMTLEQFMYFSGHVGLDMSKAFSKPYELPISSSRNSIETFTSA